MIPIPIVTCNGATLARAGAAPSVFFALDTTLVFDVPNAASFSSLTLKIVRAPDGTSPVLTSTTSVPSQITGGVAQPGDIWIRVVGQTSSGESRQITVAAVFKTRNQGIELVEVSDFEDERLLPKLVGKLVATQKAADAGAASSSDALSIQGTPVDPTAPTAGQLLIADGSKYMPGFITADMVRPGVSFTVAIGGGNVRELGQHLTNPTFTPTYSSAPSSVTIQRTGDPSPVNVSSTPNSFAYSGDYVHSTLGQTEVFTIVAVINGVTKTQVVTVTWGLRIYYGVRVDPGSGYDDAFVQALATSVVVTSRGRTIPVTAPTGQVFFIWLGTALGAPTWTVPPVEILPDDLGALDDVNAFTVDVPGKLYRVGPSGLGSYSLVLS